MRIAVVLLLAVAGLAGCAFDAPATEVVPPAPTGPQLLFREPVVLECPSTPVSTVFDRLPTGHGPCDRFGEPVLEVAGDGTVWYSATCCVGRSPPVWVSRDNGTTFEPLPFADGTGVVRDAFGIEGDFAIDDVGNVYFFDIGAAFPYFTQFRADGTHVHTSTFPMPPLVDRPWVRAGAADEAMILYNTATSSVFMRSIDGGRTWDLAGRMTFPCGLMSFAQSPSDRDHLVAAGCSGSPQAWTTKDGGRTWDGPVLLPLPEDNPGDRMDPFMQPAMDEAGNVYVPYTHVVDPEDGTRAVYLTRILADGTVDGPFLVGSDRGLVDKPWMFATRAGAVALAWYASNATKADDPDQAWILKAAVSLDANGTAPAFTVVDAQPDPVHVGPLGRSLGDFLETRVTPRGAMGIAYSDDHPDGIRSRYVQSEPVAGLAPTVFLNGPRA